MGASVNETSPTCLLLPNVQHHLAVSKRLPHLLCCLRKLKIPIASAIPPSNAGMPVADGPDERR